MSIKKDKFILFQVDDGWIVYNTAKPFEKGHTHLRSKNSALAAIDFVLKKKIPKKCSFYYLISLIRISDNEKYIGKIQDLIDIRKSKGKKRVYVNSR
jgi:hypothetical protein